MRDLSRHRPCVGAVIFNAHGQVWLGRRFGATGDHVWQFPQGGIDKGETAETALWREMQEEIGLLPEHVDVLDRTEIELIYDYPPEVLARAKVHHHGQRQVWFALRLTGPDTLFRFDHEDPPEFSRWRWGTFHDAVDAVIPFKRGVYEAIAGRFWEHTTSAT